MIRPLLIVAVALVCVAALVGIVIREGMARSSGTQVTLAMQGVDPRDLVRGHYVALRLADDIPEGQVCVDSADGEWIALRRSGSRHVAVGQYPSRDEAQRFGDIAVRGTMRCQGRTAWIDIGIDRFYINQRDATAIEKALTDGREAAAIVSVGGDGKARLVGLDVDGKRYDLNW
ncbi:hypothetical protein GOARA_048_01150 [Gordonia araii NBRC 100433]|uniref:Uncharacterized protein n=2 Tax=Gordonia araii TaxID=263909 RepID=G7H238_9ACTN|nr:hypothetical protein GOARA_048_01150 [Gordonia araii NBRC 100433]